ncbi:hypothetical protein [Nonomuraea candida]|uniref:hypothetical protein n=1 Tax=Nonomuraea candida TaxID=359159 RepID=UPI0012F97E62|nr:hypothetical protein [Nonomuraea candida]
MNKPRLRVLAEGGREGGRVGIHKPDGLSRQAVLSEVLEIAEEPFDDHAFRLRATWIIHGHLGEQAENAVVGGAGTGLKPTDLKMFVRLDDFAVVDHDGRVKYSSDKLSGLFIQVGVDQGSSSSTTDCGGVARTTADVSDWHTHPDATAVFHPKLPASGHRPHRGGAQSEQRRRLPSSSTRPQLEHARLPRLARGSCPLKISSTTSEAISGRDSRSSSASSRARTSASCRPGSSIRRRASACRRASSCPVEIRPASP